jgi:hypothetical protein
MAGAVKVLQNTGAETQLRPALQLRSLYHLGGFGSSVLARHPRAERKQKARGGLSGSRSVGFTGSGISLPAQLSQEAFGREVSVSLKELEQGIFDLV